MKKGYTFYFFLFLAVCFSATFFSSCSSSRRSIGIEEGWELLSESKVNFVRDRDEIIVESRNQFTAIRFKVEDRDIRINELVVHYENGDKLQPNIDDVIKAGEFSRVIDLARDGRYLHKIEFRYRTTGNILKGRANVLLLGKRYERGY